MILSLQVKRGQLFTVKWHMATVVNTVLSGSKYLINALPDSLGIVLRAKLWSVHKRNAA